jgi:hypothetical protein
MEQARKTGIHSLVRFVRTLKQDLSAVEAAVSERWSNGPVEGQLNRIRLANTRLARLADLVGQFRVAHAAGVSSAIRPTGKSPNPGSTEPK